MNSPLILTKEVEGVVLLTLNNPPLNLVTRDLTRELNVKLDKLKNDPGVLVVVVAGSGDRAFCAGSNLNEFPEYIKAGNVTERKSRFENETFSKLDRFPRPTIAALNGLAYGGGLELAVCCDILIAEHSTQLCLPEIKLGVFPGDGGTIRVTRRIGEGRAKEIMYLGDPIDSQTALAWGLVNRIVADGKAVEGAMDLAKQIASRPNRALQICKQAVDLSLELPEEEALNQILRMLEEAFATQDCQEGIRAFFAKRPPQFTHS